MVWDEPKQEIYFLVTNDFSSYGDVVLRQHSGVGAG